MATEQIIAQYRLEIGDLKAQVSQLEGQFKKLSDAEKKAGKEGQDAFDKTNESATKTNKGADILTSKLKTLGAAIVAAFAVEKIIAFGKASLAAFEEAEQSALQLQSAVSINGGLNADVEKLLSLSDKLETKSIFSAEQIQGLQTAALQFGLTADEVERLTPIVVDFASATGQDLQGAFSVIQAGTAGAVKGLRAYGVSLEEGGTAQENYISITEQLSNKFKGQAELISNTTAGSLKQLGDAWGEIQEQVGAAIAPIVVGFSKLLQGSIDFRDATELESVQLEKQRDELQLTAMGIYQMADGTDERTNAIKELQAQYPSLLGNLDAEKVSNDDLQKALAAVNEQYIYKIALAKGKEKLTPILEEEGEAANEAAEANRKLQEEVARLIKQSKDGTKSQVNDANDRNIALLEVLPAMESANELLSGQTTLAKVGKVSMGDLQKALDNYKEAQNEYTDKALASSDAQANFNKEVKSLKNIFHITEESAKSSGQSVKDYRKLLTSELEALAKDNDTFAIKELDRRKDLGKKSAEEERKALEELRKLNQEVNQKSKEDLAKTEADKLRIQRDAQLEKAKDLYIKAGENNVQATKEYLEIVKALNEEYDELIKQGKLKVIDDTYNEAKQKSQQNAQEELDNALSIIDDTENAKILALKQAYLKKGDFSKSEEQRVQNEIAKIQLDAEKDRIEASKALRDKQIDDEKNAAVNVAFQKALIENNGNIQRAVTSEKYIGAVTKANDEANKKKSDSDKQYTKEKTDYDKQATDFAITQATVETEYWILKNEEKIQAAAKVAMEIFNIAQQITQGQIDEKQRELEALQETFDAETEKLDEQYQQRLIGAEEYDQKQKKLKDKQVADEKKIQDEINRLKRQQDVSNRLRAIFEITLNTALGVSRLLGQPGAAFLIPATIALGLAQLATVLATPLPKYAKGTKYLKRGNNPSGTDTIPIMADEGERIVPRKQNEKYWSVYEAIDDGRFDDYMYDNYIAPHLSRAKETHRSSTIKEQANAMMSNVIDSDLLAKKIGAEIEWRMRNGIKVKGVDDIVSVLTTTEDYRKS